MPRKKTGPNPWLYTVYRNSDDRLLALDVSSQEVLRITGMNFNSFCHLMCKHKGINGRWSIMKIRKKEADAQAAK